MQTSANYANYVVHLSVATRSCRPLAVYCLHAAADGDTQLPQCMAIRTMGVSDVSSPMKNFTL